MASSTAMILVTLFVLAHLHLTEKDLREGLQQLLKFWSSLPARRSNQKRVEKELHKIRIENYRRAVKFTVHFTCMVAVGPMMQFVQEPNVYSALELLMPCIGWCVDMSFYTNLVPYTSRNVRMAITLNLIALMGASIFASPQSREDFAALEIQHLAGNLLASMVFCDWLATVPFCGIALMVGVFQQVLSPMGADLGATAVVEKTAGHLLVAITAFVMEQSACARIMADLASEDSRRLLSSFESVLKGVCDGEVLLDKNCKIVGRTECLEQLLALPREQLASQSFSDLFQDEDSHTKFSQFIASADEVADASDVLPVPAGLRVCFRTSNGLRCSVDLFHVLVPNLFQEDGQVHHLIALKEDGESRIKREEPDALPCNLIRDWHPHQAVSEAASSEGDTLEVYEELKGVTLLVNPEKFGDIEEVHLKFQRETSEPRMRLGMPTLKRLASPIDWELLWQSLEIYLKALDEKTAPESMLLGPLLMRIPGEARSYLQAAHASLSLASPPEGPPRFWLLLKDFNETRVRKFRPPVMQE